MLKSFNNERSHLAKSASEMEQQSRSFGNSENLPNSSTDSFPNGASIEHSAEYVEMPFQNHVYIPYSYNSYSGSYDHGVNGEAYSDGIDVNRNNENFLKDDSLLPSEQYVNYDNYAHVPLKNLNFDYLDDMYRYRWHQEDFYNGANFENIFREYYSRVTTNCTSYIYGGTMYFIPQYTSNGLHTGPTTHAQSHSGFTETQHTDVAQFEAELNSSSNLRLDLDSTNVESHKEATESEAPRTATINAESRLDATECEAPRTAAIKADSRLEATNTEIPNVACTNDIKTPTGATEVETILALAVTFDKRLIPASSNAEFQQSTSIANSQCIGNETNYEGSMNSNNLNDCQNSGDHNKNEHVDGKDRKNVSGHVENGSNGGQTYRNVSSNGNRRNKRDNGWQVSVNCRRRDSSGIRFNNLNSRRNGQSSSDYNSLNTQHLKDRNGNVLENADSRQVSRLGANSDVARSRDIPNTEGCNKTCPVHCDVLYDKSCETSGVSSELHKSGCSYSAAVKRCLS